MIHHDTTMPLFNPVLLVIEGSLERLGNATNYHFDRFRDRVVLWRETLCVVRCCCHHQRDCVVQQYYKQYMWIVNTSIKCLFSLSWSGTSWHNILSNPNVVILSHQNLHYYTRVYENYNTILTFHIYTYNIYTNIMYIYYRIIKLKFKF